MSNNKRRFFLRYISIIQKLRTNPTSFDGIESYLKKKEKFEYPKNFDVDEMFKNSFGVITIGNTEKIILSFVSDQRKYLGSLRIHSTQQELANDRNEYRISLKMKITYDLIKEILSFGDSVEVLEPKSVRKEIRKIYNATLKYYS